MNGILLTPDIDTKPLSRMRMEDFNPIGNTAISSHGVPTFNDYDEYRNFIIQSRNWQ